MINIELKSKGRKTNGTIQIVGDTETLTNEIDIILCTLFKECPESFKDVVDRHLADKEEDAEEVEE